MKVCYLRTKTARMQQCFQRVGVVCNVCDDWQVISDPRCLDVVWEISPWVLLQAGLQEWGFGLESDPHWHLCSLPVVPYQQQQQMVSDTNIIVLRNCTVIFKKTIVISNINLKVLDTRGCFFFNVRNEICNSSLYWLLHRKAILKVCLRHWGNSKAQMGFACRNK